MQEINENVQFLNSECEGCSKNLTVINGQRRGAACPM